MRLFKRRAGRHIDKPVWRNVKRMFRFVVWPALTAILLMWVFRAFVVAQYVVDCPQPPSGLMRGDRVLVDRRAYGWRTPAGSVFGHHTAGKKEPRRGDLVIYIDQSGKPQAGRIDFMPGDTLKRLTVGMVPPDTYGANGTLFTYESIVGKVFAVSYSADGSEPFYRCLRSGRFFIGVE